MHQNYDHLLLYLVHLIVYLENDKKRYEIRVDFKGVENSKLKAAKCLFETIASTVELNAQHSQTLTIKSNFYEIGGNSLNSIYTISKLREKGYFIGE